MITVNSKETAHSQPFRAKRIRCSHREKIRVSPKQIFPLACPIQEYKWIDKWRCEMIYSISGVVENNCIFKEEKTGSVLFNSTVPTYWITSLYDPDHFRIQFVLITSGIMIAKLDVEMNAIDDDTSSVDWTFTITATNKEANRLMSTSTEKKAKLYTTILGKSLKHYCEKGELLRLDKASIVKMGLSTNIVEFLKSHVTWQDRISQKIHHKGYRDEH